MAKKLTRQEEKFIKIARKQRRKKARRQRYEEKNDIKAIIRKWLPSWWQRNSKLAGGTLGSSVGVLIGADIMITGGATSAVWTGLSAWYTADGCIKFKSHLSKKWQNKAGQSIRSSLPIKKTLQEMENSMVVLFNERSQAHLQSQKNKITGKMNIIFRDVSTLSPTFKVMHDRKNGTNKHKFEFLVQELQKQEIIKQPAITLNDLEPMPKSLSTKRKFDI